MDNERDLDQLSRDLAHALHALPRPQAQTGGAAPPALPEPEALAAQLRPTLTPEVADFLGGTQAGAEAGIFGGGGGGPRKPFNLGNFIKNINAILPFVTTLIGLFGGPKIPPITVPVPPDPGTGPPAGAQAQS